MRTYPSMLVPQGLKVRSYRFSPSTDLRSVCALSVTNTNLDPAIYSHASTSMYTAQKLVNPSNHWEGVPQ